MGENDFIRMREFCINYGVEESFVFNLSDYEVIEIKLIENEPHLAHGELPILEKMIRMHKELEINPQGIQAIYHLLEKVGALQQEISILRRRLHRFEE